jgi:hypothetical protein
MRGAANVMQVTSATTTSDDPSSTTPHMKQPDQNPRSTPEPSWVRVVWNTVVLWVRRRILRTDRLRSRGRNTELLGVRGGLLLAAAVAVLVVIGGLVYLGNPFDLSGGSADSRETTGTSAEPLPRQDRATVPDEASPPIGEATPPPREASPGSAHAAAGTELAARPDLQISAEAAALLRSGAVDGRVLIVMAALASGDRLHEIDVAPPAASAPTANLELGVSEVDSVLQWLDSQIVLRPDRIEVRREASRSYVRLVYSSPEPPGLFPS